MTTATKLEVEKRKYKSSPALRAKAKAELDACKQRLEEVKASQKPIKEWAAALAKAARFVVDVNGDHPSMDHLRAAVEEAEQQAALSEEAAELGKRMGRLRIEAWYYRFSAGYTKNYGFPCFVVKGRGDTKAEALEAARANQRE